MPSYINHVVQAASYVDYLMAIAGASLTVLALVIAFESRPNIDKIHPMLVSSLIVAVLASFIGTHLMSGVAALQSPDEDVIGKNLGLRFFLLSYVNVDIASNCFMMSMLLLVPAFQPDLARILGRLISLIFVCLIGGQVLWTCEEVLVLAKTYEEGFWVVGIAAFIGITTFYVIWKTVRGREINGQTSQMPFVICTLVSSSSILFNLIYPNENDMPMTLDLYIFAVGSSLVFASVSSAGWLTISKVLRHDYENIGVPRTFK